MKKLKGKRKKLNNAGMTLTELTVTFAILGLFLVAATRIISYSINIYYAARGASYGLEVTNMISNKVMGMIEGASTMPQIDETGENISFIDATGSQVTIGTVTTNEETYVNIHYEPATYYDTEYEAVNWKFDEKAYMGYEVEKLKFYSPNKDVVNEADKLYPDNVFVMELTVHSPKYGSFDTTRYMKCVKVE